METATSTNSFLSSPVIGLTWTGLDENDGGCCARQTLDTTADNSNDEQITKGGDDMEFSTKGLG